MLRLGIDLGKLYRATFICQDDLCCFNVALISFRLFRKNLSNLIDFFGQMVYRPPWQKNFPYAYALWGGTYLYGYKGVTTPPPPLFISQIRNEQKVETDSTNS